MLARQRQSYILDRVREDGGVRVADLVRDLGVSDAEVEKFLDEHADEVEQAIRGHGRRGD